MIILLAILVGCYGINETPKYLKEKEELVCQQFTFNEGKIVGTILYRNISGNYYYDTNQTLLIIDEGEGSYQIISLNSIKVEKCK